MTEPIDIRLCGEGDLAEVAALFQAWQDEDAVWGLRAESVEQLRARLGPFFLVARVAGRAAGFAIGAVDDEPFCIYPNGERHLEIQDVFVARDFRSRGVGSALVSALMRAAEEQGIERFHLYSASRDWQRSVKFYERFGLKVWAFQMYKRPEG